MISIYQGIKRGSLCHYVVAAALAIFRHANKGIAARHWQSIL